MLDVSLLPTCIVGGWERPPCVLVPPAALYPPAALRPAVLCPPAVGACCPSLRWVLAPCAVPPCGVVAPTETIAMTA